VAAGAVGPRRECCAGAWRVGRIGPLLRRRRHRVKPAANPCSPILLGSFPCFGRAGPDDPPPAETPLLLLGGIGFCGSLTPSASWMLICALTARVQPQEAQALLESSSLVAWAWAPPAARPGDQPRWLWIMARQGRPRSQALSSALSGSNGAL